MYNVLIIFTGCVRERTYFVNVHVYLLFKDTFRMFGYNLLDVNYSDIAFAIFDNKVILVVVGNHHLNCGIIFVFCLLCVTILEFPVQCINAP